MEKLSLILMILSLLVNKNVVSGQEYLKGTEEWVENYLLRPKEKVAKLHFFLQDVLSGPNATVWEVARSALITSTSSSSFGKVSVVDDLITAEPDRNSMKLGRAQGLIASADLQVFALAMNMNFVFTAGPYNGSTLSITGRNPVLASNREMPVVGGTGLFRMARGFSICKTYSFDTVENYGVLEFTVYVFYA